MNLGREEIYGLSDLDLVRALCTAAREAPSIFRTDWERGFARGTEESYVRNNSLTWKQRKCVRQILIRLVEETQRRAEVRAPVGKPST
jgi:hypothetical protein